MAPYPSPIPQGVMGLTRQLWSPLPGVYNVSAPIGERGGAEWVCMG